MRHHLKFRNFRPSVLEAAEQLFAAKPWHMEAEEWQKTAQTFADAICTSYEVRNVVVQVATYHFSGGFEYQPALVEASSLSEGEETTEVEPPTTE